MLFNNRLALSSAFDQKDFSVSALFMHETLPILEARFEVVKFSDEPDYRPIHTIFTADRSKPFEYSLTFNEDRKGGNFYRLASIALPGVLVLADANFDRLYFETPWQFKDLTIEPLLKQVVENASAIAALNEHAISNVRSLGIVEENSLFGIQVPCRQRSEIEEGLISEHRSKENFVIGYGGRFLNEEKAFEVIEVLLELNQANTSVKLLWLTRETDYQQTVEFLKLESERHQVDLHSMVEVIKVCSFIEERQALCRANLFLSLRKDFLHSPPTAFYHALALGIPAIASELGPMMSVPKSSVLFVPAGAGEAYGLLEAIRGLRNNPSLSFSLSEESRRYTNLVHNPSLVGSDLIQILEYNKKLNPNVMKQKRERQLELEAGLC